ncbi:MAG: NAD(+) synthase [Proteobacteria bacterium]|nr:NAD(+) synthase [Pseudomonadota bacterium]
MAERSFFSPYAHDMVRVGVCVPRIEPADPVFNTDRTLELMRRGHEQSIALLAFPELGLSAYAIDDLLLQDALLEAVHQAVARIVEASRSLFPTVVVGAPLADGGRLYNCAVVIAKGRILGVVPKIYLPNYREFYERRWFTSGAEVYGREIEAGGQIVPFGRDLLFKAVAPPKTSGGFTFHVEICEDFWVAAPPSTLGALAGAEVLLNLSASNVVVGKVDDRRMLCASQSFRATAAYAYSASGPGESTTDLAWDGHAAIYEIGGLLTETKRFMPDSTLCYADVDIGRIRQERLRTGSIADAQVEHVRRNEPFRTIPFDYHPPEGALELARKLERFPYVPSDPAKLEENCWEAYHIQVQGLAERLKATGIRQLVIGVSGGLDSTQALIVAAKAVDALNLPRTNILGFTMPGFATGETSKGRAWRLMQAMGITAAEIDIKPAALQFLADLGHPFAEGEPVHDVTFENVQAGLRTDYLFRLANQNRALVVGTGDLSELALGWCTYGVGDQMSHYNVNGGVSKTLIQHLIRYVAGSGELDADTCELLREIVGAEISPELVPGEAAQSTEAVVGPYALQDFNLYQLTRYGFRPSKIAYLAWNAWHDPAKGAWPPGLTEEAKHAYDLPEIKRWLEVFIRRFFANQFKRSALPNGPKISSGGSLSPRGDWRMPSDASARVWLDELATVPGRAPPAAGG